MNPFDLDIDSPEFLATMRKRGAEMRRHHTFTRTHMISTVDLIVEHFGGMWAETMVFPLGTDGQVCDWGETDSSRYPTFEEAMADHDTFVQRWGKTVVKVVDSVGGEIVEVEGKEGRGEWQN